MARAPKKPSAKRPSIAGAARKVVSAAMKAASRKRAAPKRAAPAPKPAAKKPAKAAKPKAGARKAPPAPKPAKQKAPPKPPAPKAAPKPAPKAPEPPPPPPKPRVKAVPEVSRKEIADLKDELVRLRAQYEKELADLEAAFDETQSDLSGEASFDEEYADAGSFTFERERDLSLGNNIRDLLDRVRHALHKIEEGTYGLCEQCGRPISKDRLTALPYVSLDVRCKRQEEHVR